MAGAPTTEELLKRLDEQHQAYLTTFRQVHEALAKTAITTSNHQVLPSSVPLYQSSTSSSSHYSSSIGVPLPRATTLPQSTTLSPASPGSPGLSVTTPKRRRRSTADADGERLVPNKPVTIHSSVLTGESDESDADEELYVQTALPPYKYDHEDLRKHLKTYNFDEYGQLLLESVVHNKRLLHPGLFPEYPDDEQWHHSHYSVFDVGEDGAPLNRHEVVKAGTSSIDSAVWQAIQDLNADPNTSRPAVGRITIVREPSPILMGALHMTMNRDFDMDEIFELLVMEDHSQAHITGRAFHPDHRRQRTFVFEFDYFTLVGDAVQPMPWQRCDPESKLHDRPADHIPISRCSSVVALSLGGPHVRRFRNPARKASTSHGYVYDPWAPWHVLNIQCYPDHKHSMDSHDSTKHYVNGPEAFLHTLLAEFRDAQKRFEDIFIKISKLIIPPADFMFNGDLRDRLLFEDEHFTYSRRYFWAFQTLGLMNDGIKALMDAYEDTFTDDVWEGNHKTIWPLPETDSHRNTYFRKRMAGLKKEFDREIKNMAKLYDENDDRRKEIRTLRDQLFSGTSVLESRKSVELSAVTILQGHNIKLLTLVSIFFLPLTFVTSVYGMTNMDTEHNFKWFGITMATVCIPFFFLIGSLNTTSGMEFWRGKWHNLLRWAFQSSPPSVTDSNDSEDPKADVRKKRTFSATEATQAINFRKAQVDNGRLSISSRHGSKDQGLASTSAYQAETPQEIVNSGHASSYSTSTRTSPPIISLNVSTEKPGSDARDTEMTMSWWDKLTRRKRLDHAQQPNV